MLTEKNDSSLAHTCKTNEEKEIRANNRLMQHLEKLLAEQRLTDVQIRVTEGSKLGDNYVGAIFRAQIEGIKNGKNVTIRVIVKQMPTETSLTDVPKLKRHMFIREIYFYQEIVPTFREILEKYNVQLDYFPEIYATSDNPGDETLILEDLKYQGFKMNSSKMLDYPEISLVIRCLGEFHACSFVGKAKRPDLLSKLTHIDELLFHGKDDKLTINRSEKLNTRMLCSVVEEALKDEEPRYLDRFCQFADNFDKMMIDATTAANAEPYAVINHGDIWTNNVLFKHEDEADLTNRNVRKPKSLRFLDFQLCRYGSPALDLSYLLFCCCTSRVRREYYDRLLQDYYDALTDFLKRCDCNVTALFPWDALLTHMKLFGKFGGGMAVFVMHLFTNDKVEAAVFDPEKLKERLRTDQFYRETLRDIFVEMIDRDYI